MLPRLIALIVVATVALSPATLADEAPTFKVIINPRNPATSLDRTFLRNAFLKKQAAWSGGVTIRPIDLSANFYARGEFTRAVLKKTPDQLRTYWSQRVFSGKGVPPPEVSTTNAVIAYVLANPGAVGYLPADTDVRGAKVIEVW